MSEELYSSGSSTVTLVAIREPCDILEAAFRKVGTTFGVYIVLPKARTRGSRSVQQAWPAIAASLVLFGGRSFWICGDGAAHWEKLTDEAIIRLHAAARARPDLYGFEPFKTDTFTVATAVAGFDEVMDMALSEMDVLTGEDFAEYLILVLHQREARKVRKALSRLLPSRLTENG